jgi:hypothetical protein
LLAHLADRVQHHEGPADGLERMQQAARRFDWDDSARQTRAVYERVAGLGNRTRTMPPHEIRPPS